MEVMGAPVRVRMDKSTAPGAANCGGSNFKAEVEKARSIYEKLGPVVGEEGEALRKRFDVICRKLG